MLVGVANSPVRFNKAGGILVRGNVVTVAPGIEAFQLGATAEQGVVRQGNQVLRQEQFHPIDPASAGFGPSREMLSKLLDPARR